METNSDRTGSSLNAMEAPVVRLRLLVTGASGLLGYKMTQLALEKRYDSYSAYKEHTVAIGSPVKLDLTNREEVLKIISELKPDAIAHTAAYTDVDGCEINRDLAWKVNAEATRNIAVASADTDTHLIYVSTDYIFDGEKGLYTEEDSPNPISHYGYSKLKGEQFVKEQAGKWCIARTSVIYGWGSKRKENFATWLINRLRRAEEVKILSDQYVSPTLNTNLAEMLIEIAERKITGTLNTAGATRVSRYEFALRLAEKFNLNKDLIKPVEMDAMSWKAKRPRDSSLNISKALTLLNQKPLELDQSLKMMREEASMFPKSKASKLE